MIPGVLIVLALVLVVRLLMGRQSRPVPAENWLLQVVEALIIAEEAQAEVYRIDAEAKEAIIKHSADYDKERANRPYRPPPPPPR